MAEKKEQIKEKANRIASLEAEVVKAKQNLGEALNGVDDFEQKNIDLRNQLEKAMALNAELQKNIEKETKKKGKK